MKVVEESSRLVLEEDSMVDESEFWVDNSGGGMMREMSYFMS